MTRTIAMVAAGSRGDVQPYVALAKGIQAAGHTVRLIASAEFESLVTEAGLTFFSTGEGAESVIQSDAWRKDIERGNFMVLLARMRQEMSKRAHLEASILPPLLEGSDLIIAGMNGLGGLYAIADKISIPMISAYVFPFTPTRAFPSPIVPASQLGGLLNQTSFHLMRQMMWQTLRVSDAAIRRELNLPKSPRFGPFKIMNAKGDPTLYGFSKHVLPPPADWGESHKVTGYWFLDHAPNWTPPSELIAFLKDGPAPVYIGFGSMANRDPQKMTELALQALEISGQRGVLASGWGALSSADLPKSVYMLRSAPHSWLFPQMAAVIHHGGAGTTAAGLRAGVPSVIIPFFGDQGFWARRVAALGVGTPPIARKSLTASKLADAIRQATSNDAMQERAVALGEKIRAEDGIGAAVEVIESLGNAKSGW